MRIHLSIILAAASMPVIAGDVKFDGRTGPAGPAAFTPSSGGVGGRYVIGVGQGRVVNNASGSPRHVFHSFDKLNVDMNEEVRFVGPTSLRNVIARVTGGPSTIDGKLSVRLGNGQLGDGPNDNIKNTANLWLVNPAGMVFNENSSFDVRGSVVVSTARDVTVPDALQSTPITVDGGDMLLKVAQIGEFGFGQNPAAVEVTARSTRLAVRDEQTLSVIAGRLAVDRASLTAARGRVNLVSVASSGSVEFDPTFVNAVDPKLNGFAELGDIRMESAAPDKRARISAGGFDGDSDGNGGSFRGGRVMIRGGTLTVSGTEATIFANSDNTSAHTASGSGAPDVHRRGVDIELSGAMVIRGSQIDTRTDNPARSGDITIKAASVSVLDAARIDSSSRGQDAGPFFSSEEFQDIGDAGNIVIDVGDGPFEMLHTRPNQSGGLISTGRNERQRLYARAEDRHPFSDAKAGNIEIRAGSVYIGLLSQIATLTRGAGNAGNVTISATDDVTLENPSTPVLFAGDTQPRLLTGLGRFENVDESGADIETDLQELSGSTTQISARVEYFDNLLSAVAFVNRQSNEQVGSGNGGIVDISARNITVRNGATIQAGSRGLGVQVAFDPANINPATGYPTLELVGNQGLSETGTLNNRGRGGTIRIKASDSVHLDGPLSKLSVETGRIFAGQAGTISIAASNIEVDQGFNVEATSESPAGAGRVEIKGAGRPRAERVEFAEGGKILTSARSRSRGNVGSITIAADSIRLSDQPDIPINSDQTRITSNNSSLAERNPSDDLVDAIGIDAGSVEVGQNSTIAVRASSGGGNNFPTADAGRLTINADDLIVRGHLAKISAETEGAGRGGEINIVANNVHLLDGGQIVTFSQPVANASNPNRLPNGAAGIINVHARQSIVIDGEDPLRPGNEDFIAGFISTAAFSDGGKISLTSDDFFRIGRGKVVTAGAITGGDVEVNGKLVMLADIGRIVTDARESTAGNITINILSGGGYVQAMRAVVRAQSGAGEQFNGRIEITSPDKDFAAELVTLNGQLVTPDAKMHGCCELRLSRDLSSFTNKPLAGLPIDPAGWQPVLRVRR